VAGRAPATGEWVSGLPFRYAFEPARVDMAHTVNRFRMAPYLGRVNLVSVLPTVFLLLGFSLGVPPLARSLRARARPFSASEALAALAFLVVAVSAVGYLWFLIRYPELAKGDTVKASYMLHIYPCFALLGGLLLERVHAYRRYLYVLTVVILVTVWAHNLPVCITRFTIPGVG
jgi:hypothetical protein